MKSALSFLRRAHFLHGFLGCLITFNAVSVLVLWLATPLPPDERDMAGLSMLLVSLILSPVIGLTWDVTMTQNAEWKKQQKEKRAALAAAESKRDALRAFYRGDPDFLSVQVFSLGDPDTLLFRVKAAPHGHRWPHEHEGMNVVVIIAPPRDWESRKQLDAAQG